MADTPLEAQKRVEERRKYEQLTARIHALDTDIGRSLDSQQKFTIQQLRDELAIQREDVAAELSKLGWDGTSDHIEADAPLERHEPADRIGAHYRRGSMTDEVARQTDKIEAGRQFEKLEGRMVILTDEVARIRQDLAVTKVTVENLKEKIEALSIRLYQMQNDLAVTKEAVLTVQNELRRLTEKLGAPPRGLSNNGIVAILAVGLITIVIFVAVTMYSLQRPG